MVLKQDMARLKITVIYELANHCSVRVRIDSLIREPLKLIRSNEMKSGIYEELDASLAEIVYEYVQLPVAHSMLCNQLRWIVQMTLEVEKLNTPLFGKMTDSPTAQALRLWPRTQHEYRHRSRRYLTLRFGQELLVLLPSGPPSKLSNGKSKGLVNVKNGSTYLIWALTELATLMARFNPEVGAEFQRLLTRANGLHVKAI